MLSLLQDRRQQTALKVALASLLAGVIILLMHADNPFWAPALVIVMMDEYFEGSLVGSVLRILSTAAGGFFAIYAAHMTVHNELLYLTVLFLMVSVSLYGFLVYGSGWLNFAVTFTFIYLYLIMVPTGGFDMAYWRLLQVGLAAGSWIFMSAFLFPNHAYKDTKDTFSLAMKGYADFLREGFYSKDLDWEEVKGGLSKNFAKIQSTISLLPSSGRRANKTLAAQEALNSFWSVWRALGKIVLQPEIDHAQYSQYFTKTADALERVSIDGFSRNKLTAFSQEIDVIFNDIIDSRNDDNPSVSNQLFAHFFENIGLMIGSVNLWLYGSCVVDKKVLRKPLSFIWHNMRSRPEQVRHCIAGGLGCVLVVIVWFMTSWEGGICAGVSALVVGADFSLNKINLKIRLRFFGSFTGSLVAMLLVIFVVKNVALLFVCLFVGVLIFAYISTGTFKQMYFSWMATMSYVITLIPSNTMLTNFDFAIERSIGLLFGLAVMYFVMNFFFQVNPKKIMDRHENRVLGKVAGLFTALTLIATGQQGAGNLQLEDVDTYVREQVNVGDSLAKQTGRMSSWEPIRKILISTLWCCRYLRHTPVLADGLDDRLPAFKRMCTDSASWIHPKISLNRSSLLEAQEAWTLVCAGADWGDASAQLFMSELQALFDLVMSYQPGHEVFPGDLAALPAL